jgi:addiction module HigA family antidote
MAGAHSPPSLANTSLQSDRALSWASRSLVGFGTNYSSLGESVSPPGQTQVALAQHPGVPPQRGNELVRGKRGVTPRTTWLLSQASNTSPEYWLNLQARYDLAVSRPAKKVRRLTRAS